MKSVALRPARFSRFTVVTVILFLTGLFVSASAFAFDYDDVTPVDLSSGRAVAGGLVGTGHQAFEFTLDEPANVTIEVVVTEIMEGTSFEDDDSLLFLIDDDDVVLVEDDDGGEGYASKLQSVRLAPGTYYAVVATYGNEINTTIDGKVSGFSDDGESRFAYDLEFVARASSSSGTKGQFPVEDVLWDLEEIGPIQGTKVVSGEAAAHNASFSFTVGAPVSVDIEVVVTRILQGASYEDDDSMLHLFDEGLRLIAKDDDGGEGLASRITTELPAAGRYFVVVSTYGDDLDFDSDNRLRRFADTGESRFEFDLVIDTF